MNRNTASDLAKLILRVALGTLILLHGIAKLRGGMGWLEGLVVQHGLPSWFAYGVLVGEVLAPLMVLFGFFCRVGAILVFINMLFAVALVHMGELTRLNDGGGWALELQGMFIAAALALVLLGPGRFSVNQR